MALAIDSQMPSNAGDGAANAGSPDTYAFTNTAGTLLYVWVGIAVSSGTAPTPTATYGGVSMTPVTSKTTGAATNLLTLFRLKSPATGSNNVVITYTGTAREIWGGAISFSGNDTTTTEAQTNTANGNSSTPSVALTSVASGNITICCAGAGTSMSAQTQSLDWAKNVDDGSSMGNGRASTSTSTGSVTHSFTIAGTDSWAAIIAEIAAAGGGGGTTVHALSALGAGN